MSHFSLYVHLATASGGKSNFDVNHRNELSRLLLMAST